MKTCTKCGLTKEEAGFRKGHRACLDCKSAYSRQYRLDNLGVLREKNRQHDTKRRQLVNLLKMERPCYDCGGMFPPEATDWDHLPGTEKLFTIGPEQCSFNLEAVIDEIAKCQLVCSNCHRIRSKARKQKKGDE